MNTTTTETKTTSYPFLSKKQIAARLESDPLFRVAALVILFQRQTAHEQNTETTLNRNKQGFMSSHAVNGCRLAKKALSGEELTAEDLGKIESIVCSYTRQLAEHLRGEAIAQNPDLAKAAAVFGV